ncbi:hypothetical protein [Kushneria indalinina]|uniref:Uncharacterized protein n=1 Tax=Kushneria indalinina DSM 14324 TaxID=1122140 RepID=A0A3D9DRI2_9GAMM|nr:hypothetical protein [Kushneria indalinina]REC93317.1 hypothetical protein C8D72_3475 [Kushneria indalinina DSM 14324]
MEFDTLVTKLAEKIAKEKSKRSYGAVSAGVRFYSSEISELLYESNIKVTDIHRALQECMGHTPCNVRSFREHCDKYCGPKRTKEKIDFEKPAEIERFSILDKEMQTDGKEEVVPNDNQVSEDWQLIYNQLGPMMKPKLSIAIDKGLTLERAYKSLEKSQRDLRELVSQFYLR